MLLQNSCNPDFNSIFSFSPLPFSLSFSLPPSLSVSLFLPSSVSLSLSLSLRDLRVFVCWHSIPHHVSFKSTRISTRKTSHHSSPPRAPSARPLLPLPRPARHGQQHDNEPDVAGAPPHRDEVQCCRSDFSRRGHIDDVINHVTLAWQCDDVSTFSASEQKHVCVGRKFSIDQDGQGRADGYEDWSGPAEGREKKPMLRLRAGRDDASNDGFAREFGRDLEGWRRTRRTDR